jgi:type II secretory pathway component PulC
MTKRMERWMERLLNTTTVLLLAGTLAVVYVAFKAEEVSVDFKTHSSPVESGPGRLETSNETVRKLADTQMTRTVAPKAEVQAPKPPAPKLSSILKLKGIMDFGDPKANEAILENLRTNQIRGYKAGQSIEGIDAKIIKIENDVYFEYDGQKIKLDMNGDEAASSLPVAGQGEETLSLKK